MAEYILSVDGGGTKTEFCISDMEGHIKESVVAWERWVKAFRQD